MKPAAWIPPAALSLVCLLLAAGLELRGPAEDATASPVVAPAEPDPRLSEFLGGLAAGDRIAAWTVLGVRGEPSGEVVVDFARDDLRFSVSIAPLGTVSESAPMQTETHGLYYGHAQPAGATIPDGAVRAILGDLARRLRANPKSRADQSAGLGGSR